MSSQNENPQRASISEELLFRLAAIPDIIYQMRTEQEKQHRELSQQIGQLVQQNQMLNQQNQELRQQLQLTDQRIASIEESVTQKVTSNLMAKIDERLERHERATAQRLASFTSTTPNNPSPEDECEIRVLNIPRVCTLAPHEIVRRVLTAIHCVFLANSVIDVRTWNPPVRPGQPTSSLNSAPTYSIVFQVSSPLSRNKILRAAPRLKNLTMQDVLGVDAPGHIFLRQLLPKEIHSLYLKASIRSRELGYLPPTIRSMTVHARQTAGVNLIPVHSVVDIDALPSLTPATPVNHVAARPALQNATRSNINRVDMLGADLVPVGHPTAGPNLLGTTSSVYGSPIPLVNSSQNPCHPEGPIDFPRR